MTMHIGSWKFSPSDLKNQSESSDESIKNSQGNTTFTPLNIPLILAPMAGVTDRPFRKLCRQMGASYAVSEMVTSRPDLLKTRKTQARLNHEGEIAPIGVQILGTQAHEMAQAAQFNVQHGADIIDINMGCPAKKVCNVSAGSALLKDEQLVREILASVVDSVTVPVTLKIRTGWDKENRNALNIAHIAQECGIQALTVHGRTRACAYRGEAEYDTIKAVKQQVNIPIIANGDIDSAEKALEVLQYTQADAIMIGRKAMQTPWIFSDINHYLRTGAHLPEPSMEKKGAILLNFLEELYGFYGQLHGVRIARKHIASSIKTLHGGEQFWKKINRISDAQQQFSMTEHFFSSH